MYKEKATDDGFVKELYEGLKPLSLKELLNKDYPPTQWLVQDIIPENSIILLSASPACFKTWFSMDLSLRVASGDKFLGHFDTKQTGVLILDAESGSKQAHDRFKKLGANQDLPIYYKSCNRKRMSQDYATAILVECLDKNIKLVIFDSLTRFHNSNENDANEMSRLFESFYQLKNQGVSCLIICHNRKAYYGGNESQNRLNLGELIRGSSDILAACDLHLAIERLKDRNAIRISQTKNRFDEEAKPFVARLNKIDNNHCEWEFVGVDVTKEDRLNDVKEKIIKCIVANPGKNQKQLLKIYKGTYQKDISDKAFYGLLKKMAQNEEAIVKSGNKTEKLYFIEEKGETQNV